MQFASITEAIAEIKAGRCLIVCDDEDRENECDLLMAADKITNEWVNFMAKEGRGLICAPITKKRASELALKQMVSENTEATGCKFTVSVDAKGTTTGISAAERAMTIRRLLDPEAKPEDFNQPGHIFPLIAEDGGVLVRAGHTEAAVDLAQMAGLTPAGVICEIMNEDGTMMRAGQVWEFAEKHNLKVITIADLIEYRFATEQLVERVAEIKLPTDFGQFKMIGFTNEIDNKEHVAVVKGEWEADEPVLVRVHSECLTGDVFHSQRCDCQPQLETALQMIEREGKGVLLYMRQEGRGIGLLNKLKAYQLQEAGYDTVEANQILGFKADQRHYGVGAQILANLGIKKLRLMTNNPRKLVGLEGYGLEVVERVPIQTPAKQANIRYLETKKNKLGHLFDQQ